MTDILKKIYDKYQVCKPIIIPGDYDKSEFAELAYSLANNLKNHIKYKPNYVFIIFGSGDDQEIFTALYVPIKKLEFILVSILYDDASDIYNIISADMVDNNISVFSTTLRFDNCCCTFSIPF
jgi:hypothetical protein